MENNGINKVAPQNTYLDMTINSGKALGRSAAIVAVDAAVGAVAALGIIAVANFLGDKAIDKVGGVVWMLTSTLSGENSVGKTVVDNLIPQACQTSASFVSGCYNKVFPAKAEVPASNEVSVKV